MADVIAVTADVGMNEKEGACGVLFEKIAERRDHGLDRTTAPKRVQGVAQVGLELAVQNLGECHEQQAFDPRIGVDHSPLGTVGELRSPRGAQTKSALEGREKSDELLSRRQRIASELVRRALVGASANRTIQAAQMQGGIEQRQIPTGRKTSGPTGS